MYQEMNTHAANNKLTQEDLPLGCRLLPNREVDAYAKNTIASARKIAGVIKVMKSEAIKEILKIASTLNLSLYPISTGKNWGYGCASPVTDNCYILDLSSLKQISDFDSDLGTVTIEPGVTQEDLYHFLKMNGDEYMVPTTGAGPSASILGNALERGYGLTPYSDHFEAVTNFEGFLANGDTYQSAMAEMGGQAVNKIFKWGIGPYLDGIFTQSNFAIIIKATIKLARKPSQVEMFFFSLKDDSHLEQAVTAIKKLKTELGSILGAVNLMNLHRVLSMLEPAAFNNEGSLPNSLLEQLGNKHQLTSWTGCGGLYGQKEILKPVKRIISKNLKPLCKRLVFISPQKVKIIESLQKFLPNQWKSKLEQQLYTIKNAFDAISGVPTKVALPLAYIKNKKPMPKTNQQPSLDNCGLIWHAPLIPLVPKEIRKHIKITHETCLKNKVNPLITLTIFSDQCCDSTVPIVFDKEDVNEYLNAKECYEELVELELKEGFVPYRLSIDMMKKLIKPEHASAKLNNIIKQTLDPQNIIAPGRYAIG